jgi:hypothetical protein
MTESNEGPGAPRNSAPTYKARNAVQRSVTALLDELAPERVLRRIEELPGPVEQHRTPNGCVLQAANCAVSVSWFPEETRGGQMGELHVLVWSGTVARRGATSERKGAKMLTEYVLRPIVPPVGDCLWRATDGSEYDPAALAVKCLAMLQDEVLRAAVPRTHN